MSFNPSSISWSVRINAANAYKNTGLTTPATTDGDIVQGLIDLSGNTNHFNQASSASGPKLKLNRAGGKAALYFDAATPCTLGCAHNSSLGAMQSGDYSFYIIARPTDVSAGNAFNTVLAKCTSLGSARVGFMFSAETFLNFASLTDSTKGQTSYRTQAVCDIYTSGTTTEKVYRRGMFAVSTSSTPQSLDTTNPITVGGITGTTNYAFAGEVYEIFAIGRAITNAELLNMDNYAAATYGVSSAVALFSGNSMVYGSGGTPGTDDPVTLSHPIIGADVATINNGVPSEQTPQMTTRDAALYTPSFMSAILNPLVHIGWEVYNDINVAESSAAVAYANIIAWAQQSRSAGCKGIVIASSLPDSSSSDETKRQAVRALLLADFTIPTSNPYVFLAKPGSTTYADVFYDAGNDYFLGSFGSNTNHTYYNSDDVHPNATGNAILAPNFAFAVRLAASIATIAGGGGGSGFVRPGTF